MVQQKNKKLLAQKQFLEKKLMFKYLLHLSCPGVFALVNEKDKKILIKTSNNIAKSIFDTIGNMQWYSKELNRDKKKLQLRILDTCSIENRDAFKLQHITLYKAQGYTLYNKEKPATYKARARMVQRIYNGPIIAIAEVVSSGKRVYSVAEFDTIEEAERFVKNTPIYEMLKMRKK